jgi:hypothetical protein
VRSLNRKLSHDDVLVGLARDWPIEEGLIGVRGMWPITETVTFLEDINPMNVVIAVVLVASNPSDCNIHLKTVKIGLHSLDSYDLQ